jgi:chemotaxis protein methyltransferase CheR
VLQRDGGELERFVSAVTNNETHLFRARDQFDVLFTRGLELLRGGMVLDDRVRILSAACSSGEEPYSIVFCASEAGITMQGLDVVVHGFDIDRERIRHAQSGICSRRSAQTLNRQQLARYLVQDEAGVQRVKPEFRSRTSFAYGNLIELGTFQQFLPFDVVYCRNALIYFSPSAQRRAVQNLAAVLRPGGLLFLGHSESVIGMIAGLETVRLGNCIAYRKTA